ncbi:hypothetical protein PUN28_008080 [Cardiocondyla obscurior]|uniref:Secreted protein n=1 Tax=Cardiocondyla obscurior TaxID=286306 RepID=A0AAW2FWK7_9HYME
MPFFIVSCLAGIIACGFFYTQTHTRTHYKCQHRSIYIQCRNTLHTRISKQKIDLESRNARDRIRRVSSPRLSPLLFLFFRFARVFCTLCNMCIYLYY